METDNFTKNVRYILDYLKKYDKKSYLNWTEKQQDEFIEKCDSDLLEDLVSCFDINPDELTWEILYPRYQELHREKYGKELK